jgi:hypothetical protein
VAGTENEVWEEPGKQQQSAVRQGRTWISEKLGRQERGENERNVKNGNPM